MTHKTDILKRIMKALWHRHHRRTNGFINSWILLLLCLICKLECPKHPWKEFARLSDTIWAKFSPRNLVWKDSCIKDLYFNSVSNVYFLKKRNFLGGPTLWSETRFITSKHLLSRPYQGGREISFTRRRGFISSRRCCDPWRSSRKSEGPSAVFLPRFLSGWHESGYCT